MLELSQARRLCCRLNARCSNVTPPNVTLNLFQGLCIHSDSGRAARWTLKQVQGDGGLFWGDVRLIQGDVRLFKGDARLTQGDVAFVQGNSGLGYSAIGVSVTAPSPSVPL